MSGEYVPMAQRTPAQQEAYRASSRERNRRYYARKRQKVSANLALALHLENHGTVACVKCGEDTIPVCGFCNAGLA